MASDLVDLHYLDIFHPDRLHSDEVCDVALEVISALQPELRISMWQQSLQVEGATCFIISNMGDEAFSSFKEHLLGLPLSAPGVAHEIMTKLLQCLSSLQEQSSTSSNKYVTSAHGQLSHLFNILKGSPDMAVTVRQPRDQKHGYVSASHPETVSPLSTAALALGYPLPLNARDLEKTRLQAARDAEDLLTEGLMHMRCPGNASQVKVIYIARNTAASSDTYILSMSETLALKSADKFGPWQILLSTRAEGDLRQSRRRSSKEIEIAIRVMRNLSRGAFTDDNHQKLAGPKSCIPIYRAWVLGDTRLVYYIDCIDDVAGSGAVQVIKVLGIFTLAQMDDRMWDTISHSLSRRDADDRQRCTIRDQESTGLYVPRTFPTPSKAVVCWEGSLPICMDPQSEIQDLLSLQKYTFFSQAWLKGLVSKEDVVHPFAVASQERDIIEHRGSCFVIGRSGTGKTTTMLYKMLSIERARALAWSSTRKPRQLFVTKSPTLATQVGEHFNKLEKSLELAGLSLEEIAQQRQPELQSQNIGLIHARDMSRRDLPDKFSELRDEHFPLFVTYEKVLQLLENDLFGASRCNIVNFIDFKKEFYSGHDQKGLDPMLVWNQITAVIKGSESALKCETGYLDRSTYISRSSRSVLQSEAQLDSVYDVFEKHQAYFGRKRKGGIDAADRVRQILLSIKEQSGQYAKVDFLYVDEVQDLLLADTLLMRALCRNANGLFWGGDTAQNISPGSAFRFSELKSLMFRADRQLGVDAQMSNKDTKATEFHLNVNYRSHNGIVTCASSLVKLLLALWPDSIDNIGKERGIMDGAQPVFIDYSSYSANECNSFLRDEAGQALDFGHEQCIIVRDDASRAKLLDELGHQKGGLVSTILNSKGMEYDDVLLWNFFQDSGVKRSQWEKALWHAEQSHSDHIVEPGILTIAFELKNLYVAITRARRNIWIVDTSDVGLPLKDYWLRNNLITEGTLDMKLAKGADSNQQNWKMRARILFDNEQFDEALWAYRKAGCIDEVLVVEAYILKEQADAADALNAPTLYRRAGNAFLDLAGKARLTRAEYLPLAARCLALAGQKRRAADVYLQACQYSDAAMHYLEASAVELALTVTRSHPVIESVARPIKEAAIEMYLQRKDFQLAQDILGSFAELQVLIEQSAHVHLKAAALEWHGDYINAAEIHFQQGRDAKALGLLLQRKSDPDHLASLVRHLHHRLWSLMSFGMVLAIRHEEALNTQVQLLLSAISSIEEAAAQCSSFDELRMFQAIMNDDSQALRDLSRLWSSDGMLSARALLCLDALFSIMADQVVSGSEDPSTLVALLRGYISRLRSVMSSRTGAQAMETRRRLFSIKQEGQHYILTGGTFVYTLARKRGMPTTKHNGAPVIQVIHNLLDPLIVEGLRRRLENRLNSILAKCGDAGTFTPSQDMLNGTHSARDEELALGRCIQLNMEMVEVISLGYDVFISPAHKRHWLRNLYLAFFSDTKGTPLGTLRVMSDIKDINAISNVLHLCDKIVDEVPIVYSGGSVGRIEELALMWLLRPRPSWSAKFARGRVDFLSQTIERALHGPPAQALNHGLGAVSLIAKRLPDIEVMFLVRFLEWLLAFIVLVWKKRRQNEHVFMPKSWVVHAARDFEVLDASHGSLDVRQITQLCRDVLSIITAISNTTGPCALLHGNVRIRQCQPEMKQLLSSKLYLTIRILLCNVRIKHVRDMVKAEGPRRYAAMHPQDFYSEAEISSETTEVMIFLCKGQASDVRPFGDQAWKVTYDSEDDLKRLIDSSFDGPEGNGVTLDMDDHSSVPISAAVTQLDALDIKTPAYSFEQLQILAKLPRIHHRSRIRAHQENMALLEASQKSLTADIRAFEQVAAEDDWAGQRIYSRLFFGVGPTMIYATKAILTWAEKEKRRLKKARQKGKLDVGIAGKDDPQTLVNRLNKTAQPLKDLLVAKSNIHRTRDIRALRGAASRLYVLGAMLPLHVYQKLSDHIETAFAATVLAANPELHQQAMNRLQPKRCRRLSLTATDSMSTGRMPNGKPVTLRRRASVL